jgi:hypothetical protein
MIGMRAFCLAALCSALLGCGSSSSTSSATGRWNVVLTSAAAQQGQQGEQATFTVSLIQSGTALTGSVTSLVQPSSCFPADSPLFGAALSGQVTQGGEAIANFQAAIQLPGTAATTNPLDLMGDLGATSGAGVYSLKSGTPPGCEFPSGTFTMNPLP